MILAERITPASLARRIPVQVHFSFSAKVKTTDEVIVDLTSH